MILIHHVLGHEVETDYKCIFFFFFKDNYDVQLCSCSSRIDDEYL